MKELIRRIVDETVHQSEYGMRFVTSTQKVDFITDSIFSKLWISVKDRMPEAVGFYLVNVDSAVASKARGAVEIGECYKSVDTKGMYEILKFHDYVTHWMPRPESPQTEKPTP